MASGPYREAAFVEREDRRKAFRYVEAKSDKSTNGEWVCPICWEPFQLVFACNPFRRVGVAGLLWWRKCPLAGVHWHRSCFCGARIVGGIRAVDVKEESFSKEKP